MIQVLERQTIHPAYVNLIEHIYSNNFSFIRLHQDSTIFQLHKEVRQGGTLLPKLFIACLEEIFKKLDCNEKKYSIKVDGEYLSNLRFADNIVLLTNSADQLQSGWTKDESTENQSYVYSITLPIEHYIRRSQT